MNEKGTGILIDSKDADIILVDTEGQIVYDDIGNYRYFQLGMTSARGKNIRELFCAADAEMEPGDGEQIIETCDLKISPGPTGHEIIAEMTDGTGETTRLVLTLRCERGTPE